LGRQTLPRALQREYGIAARAPDQRVNATPHPTGKTDAGPFWKAWRLFLPWVRWPWQSIDTWSKEWTWAVTFDASWRYELPAIDQDDANKIFGATIGTFDRHRDSARFSAFYHPRTGCVHVVAYCYINGQRIWHQASWQVIHTQEIDVTRILKLRLTGKRWELHAYTPAGAEIGCTFLDHGLPPERLRWGAGLGHYFGGDQKAPHEIRTRFEKP
jgi:hypothetical protein